MQTAVAAPDTSKAAAPATPLGYRRRQALRWAVLKARVNEYLAFDAAVLQALVGSVGLVAAWVLGAVGRTRQSFALLSKLHRADFLSWANRRAERLAQAAAAGTPHPLLDAYRDHVERTPPGPTTAKFFDDPTRLFGSMATVLKSPSGGEKGVLVLNYGYVYAMFLKLFDADRVTSRYHLVLEPSWCGFCDANILSYGRLGVPVFVQSGEPRDTAFLQRLGSNLVAVPVAGNWWVDHRVFRPMPGVAKDADVVMVAGWAGYKRHFAFFDALRRLRIRGVKLRAVLIGYPVGSTMAEVRDLARLYGVADQVECYERLTPAEVNRHMNRARVNLLWSRREGFNRVIVEGMFAGTPCVLRAGFNYGHPYPYINEYTGRYATETGLPDTLLTMVERADRFDPRSWVMANMTCQKGTELLGRAIGEKAVELGQPWSGGLAVKVSYLSGMGYWDEADRMRFDGDYAFLRSAIRPKL
ncbi:MAG: glycosyltransferase [Gemmataceae bacterium]